MQSYLKHGDKCQRVSFNKTYSVDYFFNGKKLNHGDIIPSAGCINCGKTVNHIVDLYCDRISVTCSNCGHTVFTNQARLFFNIKTDGIRKERTYKYISYKSNIFRFRMDPVPGIKNYSNSHNHYGSSKKGLIVSSYRNSFDEQCINYDSDEVIKFKHKHSKETMINSGMDSFDSPYRHRVNRSWKRSKKRKQWM